MTELPTWRGIAWRTLLGVALLICANIATFHYSEYFQQEHAYHEAVAEARTHHQAMSLLAGDSHIAHSLNALLNSSRTGPAYSLAYQGDSLRECYAKVRYTIEKAPHFQTLIISAEPHMFGGGRVNSSNRAFADRYFLLRADQAGLDRGLAAALMNQVPLFNDDFVQYMRKSVTASVSHKGKAAVKTLQSAHRRWSQLSEGERHQRADDTGRGDHREIGQHREPFYWYGRILELARKHGVRVIGVRLPVHHRYAAHASQAQLASIDQFLLQGGVEQIVDLRNFLSDPLEFDDPDHLSAHGAEQTLRELERRLGTSLAERPQGVPSPAGYRPSEPT